MLKIHKAQGILIGVIIQQVGHLSLIFSPVKIAGLYFASKTRKEKKGSSPFIFLPRHAVHLKFLCLYMSKNKAII